MTPEEAKLFVNEIFEDILPRGRTDRLPDIYTPDVLGHYNNKNFYFDDIFKRCEILGKNIKSFHFKVDNVTVIDDLIICQTRQNWISKKENILHEIRNTLIYRIRGKKICELWTLQDPDATAESYQEINQDFESRMKSVQVEVKSKKTFLDRLCINQYLYSAKSVKLTQAEKECLYYYLNGYSSKETGQALHMSSRTVETHIVNLKEKLNCHSKAALRNCILMVKAV